MMAQKLAALKTPLILRDMASPIARWNRRTTMSARPHRRDGSHPSVSLTSTVEKGGREKSLATHSSKLRPKQLKRDQT